MRGVGLILKNISVGYGPRILVHGLDAEFPAGRLTAIVGRNGTGKSTLLRTMAGLMKPVEGEVMVAENYESGIRNYELTALHTYKFAKFIGFVSTGRIRVTNLKVRDVAALGRTPYTGWLGRLSDADRRAVSQALERVGMSDFAGKEMDTLSDGEAQKVMIARVLAQDTPVILLDEPTAFLDFYARREVCELLAGLSHEHGKTIVFSSHELDLVGEFADVRLTIEPDGRVELS